MDDLRCSKNIFSGARWDFGGHQCPNKAVIESDGKPYCKIHDPEYEKAKKKAQEKKWDIQMKIDDEKWRRKSAIEKACEGVPTEVLEKIKVKDLLKED